MSLNTNSLERLVPQHLKFDDVTGKETLLLHVERYEFAARHTRPGRLLDIACGVGYGTRLMIERSQQCVKAVGVDISEEAISYAAERYGTEKLEFVVADASHFSYPVGFDTIVSLETIEHLGHAQDTNIASTSFSRASNICRAMSLTAARISANRTG